MFWRKVLDASGGFFRVPSPKEITMRIQFQFIIGLLVLYSTIPKSNGSAIYTIARSNEDTLFRVERIDSLNNYYLIYVTKDNTWFKIVSKKMLACNCENIKKNGLYRLELSSIWRQEIMIGKINVSPSLNLLVTCLAFDDSTSICLERDSINDLYQAGNLRGLCITK